MQTWLQLEIRLDDACVKLSVIVNPRMSVLDAVELDLQLGTQMWLQLTLPSLNSLKQDVEQL